MTIPAGPLRETINNLKKYDHIFLNGNLENIDNIQKKILSINPRSNVYIGKYEVTNINEFKKWLYKNKYNSINLKDDYIDTSDKISDFIVNKYLN